MGNTFTQLSPDQVKKQLQKLLNEEEFRKSPILARFLEYVVHTKLAGRGDEIKEYTIGIKVLGRPADFNPQLDAVVRIHASRLRNILIQYYYSTGKDAPVVISIPKGGYVPLFESNNRNLQHNVSPSTEIIGNAKPTTLHKKVRTNPLLAVLPFHDLSPKQSNDSFLTALGEQLSSELAKFDNLSVISFYATRKMDAVVDHLKDLKNEGIDYVLTGSLRLFNDTLRLNIQLITVDSGNIIWSDSFLHHQLTDKNTFDVQDEIISQIANAIADDPKMVSMLNKGRQWENLNGGNLVQDAIDMYFDYTYDYNSTKFEATLRAAENAYKIAYNHVFTVSILSKLYLDQYACAAEHNKDMLQKGIELAKKAVCLDPHSQYSRKTLAWGLILAGEKHKVEEAINYCIKSNPTSASSLSTLGLGLIMMGEYEKGNEMLTRSLKLHQNPYACTKLGFSLYYYKNKNYTESSKWLHLLPPFDIPFCRLLNIAIDGNLKGKAIQSHEVVLEMRGNEKDIIDRIVLDPTLRTSIVDGWKRAGFVQ